MDFLLTDMDANMGMGKDRDSDKNMDTDTYMERDMGTDKNIIQRHQYVRATGL